MSAGATTGHQPAMQTNYYRSHDPVQLCILSHVSAYHWLSAALTDTRKQQVLTPARLDDGVVPFAHPALQLRRYCSTDMSSFRGTQSAAAGADTPVWLALMPQADFKTGGFYRDRQQQSFT
eukprot:GHRQ01039944.1.p1 GENE.GHRQ01039944.1~~GHRQ01039944.1.p1  ORF type:complete len:121 (+),score=39.40 GHRQ01039944.1:170-532(+)